MKKLIRYFVDNPHFTLVMIGFFVVFGLLGLPSIKISQNPEVEFPTLEIRVDYPNVTQKVLRDKVAEPLLELVRQNRKLKDVQLTISESSVEAVLRFAYGAQLNDQYWDIKNRLNKLQQALSEQAFIELSKSRISDRLTPFVLGITAESRDKLPEAIKFAELLKGRLETIPEISQMEIHRPQFEVRIELDHDKMDSLNLGFFQVTRAIQKYNKILPGGKMLFGDRYIGVEIQKSYYTLDDIRNTPLFTPVGNLVRLGEIATVKRAEKPDSFWARYNGKPAALLSIKLTPKANVLWVKKNILAVQASVEGALPDYLKMNLLYDEATGVKDNLSGLLLNMAQGVGLLTLTLLFFMGYRATLMISMVLPLAIVFATGLLSLTDYGIQQVSIAAFIIALGLIVDNGIVVTEMGYILSHFKKVKKREAAIQGAGAVATALVASTLATMLGFAPIFFLRSDAGLYLRSLSLTIWLTLFSSLVIAITVLPFLMARFGTEPHVRRLPRLPNLMLALMKFRDRFYIRGLSRVARHPILLILVIVSLFVGSVYMVKGMPSTLFPPIDDPYFYVNIDTRPSSTLDRTNDIVKKIERELERHPQIEDVITLVGNPLPVVNISMNPVKKEVFNAQILVKTKIKDSLLKQTVIEQIDKKLDAYRLGTDVLLYTFSYNRAPLYPISVHLQGSNFKEVLSWSKTIEEALVDTPGIKKVDNVSVSDLFVLKYDVNPKSTYANGIPEVIARQALAIVASGYEVQRFRSLEGEEFPIVLRVPGNPTAPLSIFDEVHLASKSGQRVSLSKLTTYTFDEKKPPLEYKFFKPAGRLNIQLSSGAKADDVQAAIADRIDQLSLPKTLSATFSGVVQARQETFGGFTRYTVLIVLLIFSIFVLVFRSFLQPFLIFSTLPLSFIGSIWLLLASGQSLTFLAMIGLASLTGIVVNDSILLIDQANKLARKENYPPFQAAITAAEYRFVPILLTSMTTIVGLLPLALGHTMFKPMAIVIIGGLLSSTIMLLFFVPTYFYLIERWRVARMAKSE